ncbi:CPBP family intramembrane metalloprotease [Clostridium sp. SHJSY1]|uniref:CPBP family intramembrane glutamic endopeptidase n=1 Tax=Clostridium sp. SHJSY1 TaxID=2942483 RepID=UPI0028769D0E|nr:CPBP family intramembrane glutamic endopeptidase [Clostridium sp. SHJSY1]MDS0528181.1 CPBP family intramembrane metalloprotease [Clostridium sp. SHJSY1]
MKKLYKSNIYFLLILIGSIIIPYGLRYIYFFLGVRDTKVMLLGNHIIIFFIPAIIYLIVTKSNFKETLRLNKLHLKDIGIVILIAIVSWPLMMCVSAIGSMFTKNNLAEYVTSISSTPYIIMVLLFGVMPAITEEINLRGIVLSGYDGQTKFKAAIMTGILFGIFHLDLHQFLYATALGFLMAYVVRVTNSIFSSMLIHFIVNTLSTTMQKVNFTYNSSNINDAKSIDPTSISLDYKFAVIQVAVFLGICFAGLVYKLIKVLERLNDERISEWKVDMSRDVASVEKEKIINIPFIAIIIVYIIAMIFIR